MLPTRHPWAGAPAPPLAPAAPPPAAWRRVRGISGAAQGRGAQRSMRESSVLYVCALFPGVCGAVGVRAGLCSLQMPGTRRCPVAPKGRVTVCAGGSRSVGPAGWLAGSPHSSCNASLNAQAPMPCPLGGGGCDAHALRVFVGADPRGRHQALQPGGRPGASTAGTTRPAARWRQLRVRLRSSSRGSAGPGRQGRPSGCSTRARRRPRDTCLPAPTRLTPRDSWPPLVNKLQQVR